MWAIERVLHFGPLRQGPPSRETKAVDGAGPLGGGGGAGARGRRSGGWWRLSRSGVRMPPVTGHVFVVPGNLQSLRVDDVLISTDYGGRVGKTWWPVFGWDEREGEIRSRSPPQLSPKQRVALVPRTSSEGPN